MNRFLLILLICSTSYNLHANSLDLRHPFVSLEEKEMLLSAETAYVNEEHEFERSAEVLDEFKYSHLLHSLGFSRGIKNNFQYSFFVGFKDRGELEKTYAPSTGLMNQSINYDGFHRFDFKIQKNFETNDSKDRFALMAHFSGSPFRSKETNQIYGGKDIFFSLYYSHLYTSRLQFYGELKMGIVGKKKIQKFDNDQEVVDAFSVFGNSFGLQYYFSKLWIENNFHFNLTTDYNSKSRNYTRLTDKGFTIGGKVAIGYLWNPSFSIKLEHLRESLNFNIITDVISSQTEFEIERQETVVGLIWAL